MCQRLYIAIYVSLSCIFHIYSQAKILALRLKVKSRASKRSQDLNLGLVGSQVLLFLLHCTAWIKRRVQRCEQLIVGFRKLFIRAVRDNTKKLKMNHPRTIPEIGLLGVQKTEAAMCTRMAPKGFPEKGVIESGFEK